jgi:hypothetical protein
MDAAATRDRSRLPAGTVAVAVAGLSLERVLGRPADPRGIRRGGDDLAKQTLGRGEQH